jgi:hypothetical protein
MRNFAISFTVSGLWVFQYCVALWVDTDVSEGLAASLVRVGVSMVSLFAAVLKLAGGRQFWMVFVYPRNVTTQGTKI